MSEKLPSIQFYPGDWKRDAGVQSLDFEARGIWFELLLLMWDSEERGKLSLNGRPMSEMEIARMLGTDIGTIKQNLSKILANGVATLEQNSGKIINRRMVRDEAYRLKKEHISHVRAEAGRFGGKQKASKLSSKIKQNDRASSSISSSSSKDIESTNVDSPSVPVNGTSGKTGWELSDLWLKEFVLEQELLTLPEGVSLDDPKWWANISLACGGLNPMFLQTNFALMGNWCTNPNNKPPVEKTRGHKPNTGGWKNFIGNWLVRAYKQERRYGN